MKILITNDDGIMAYGIEALRKRFEEEHEVRVIVPDVDRSGSSHGTTFWEAIHVKQVSDTIFTCSGTPVDCVFVGCIGMKDFQPDFVLSGINHGQNLGSDLIYSGTASAARQGALFGIPSIATSLIGSNAKSDFNKAADFLAHNLDNFNRLWKENIFFNVNFPVFNNSTQVEVTSLSHRYHHDDLISYQSPRGGTYFFFTGDGPYFHKGDKHSDSYAVANKNISVSMVPVFHVAKNHGEESNPHAFFLPGGG